LNVLTLLKLAEETLESTVKNLYILYKIKETLVFLVKIELFNGVINGN